MQESSLAAYTSMSISNSSYRKNSSLEVSHELAAGYTAV